VSDKTPILDSHQRDDQPTALPECIHQIRFQELTKGEEVDLMNGSSIPRLF